MKVAVKFYITAAVALKNFWTLEEQLAQFCGK
jgi:hypothetical protein